MRKPAQFASAVLVAMTCSQLEAMNLNEAIQSTLDSHKGLRADINNRSSRENELLTANR